MQPKARSLIFINMKLISLSATTVSRFLEVAFLEEGNQGRFFFGFEDPESPGRALSSARQRQSRAFQPYPFYQR